MRTRLAALGLALVVAALVATGCAPEPEPAATPPVFATEEEAFAAAEATYRAYVDALNQVDLSDPETFEAVYAWTTGDLNSTDRKGLSTYFADGVTVTGNSHVDLIAPTRASDDLRSVDLAVCLDVSEVDVRDSSGASLVDPERIDVQTLSVRLEMDVSSPTSMLIGTIGPRDGDPACG